MLFEYQTGSRLRTPAPALVCTQIVRADDLTVLGNRKINAPVAGVLCQCNAAVMPDRCSVRPMARDRGCPRVLHRPIRAAGAFRNERCGKLCSPWARQVKRALRSGDVGNRVVGEWQAGVRGPARDIERRTSFGGQLCLVE
jgi:hypothetical protein